jgi:hypothetical protein
MQLFFIRPLKQYEGELFNLASVLYVIIALTHFTGDQAIQEPAQVADVSWEVPAQMLQPCIYTNAIMSEPVTTKPLMLPGSVMVVDRRSKPGIDLGGRSTSEAQDHEGCLYHRTPATARDRLSGTGSTIKDAS